MSRSRSNPWPVRPRAVLGLAAGLALAVMVLTAAVRIAAAQEQGGEGSLIIYAFACPPGVIAGADACRAAPHAGVPFTVFAAGQDNGVGATTDANGVASFSLSGLAPGNVVVVEHLPAGYADFDVACSQASAENPDGGGITLLDVPAGAFVTCQWYNLAPQHDPGGNDDGSLTVRAYACPSDFAGDYAACRANPLAGVAFTVAAAGQDNGVGGTTDAAGTAAFPLFAADLSGDVDVVGQLPSGYASFEAACQSGPGIAADYVYADTGITLLGVAAGAAIACDWFHFAAAAVTTPTGPPTPPAGRTPAAPPPTPAVGQLPNTGTGATIGWGTSEAALLGVLTGVAVAGVSGASLLAAGRRSGRKNRS